jgi:hypothetical protein
LKEIIPTAAKKRISLPIIVIMKRCVIKEAGAFVTPPVRAKPAQSVPEMEKQ